MSLDDLRIFLDALRISDEDRDIIWTAAINHGQQEYARGHRAGYDDGIFVAGSDWP